MQLNYSTKNYTTGQTAPTIEQLERWLSSFRESFTSLNFSFLIKYYLGCVVN